ncbi:MAG: hypothetical protein WBQ57_11335 [Rhodanobacteraceae bacterium]
MRQRNGTLQLQSRRAAARRTAWIFGVIAIVIFVLSIVEVALHK